jgi:hypothetical protein
MLESAGSRNVPLRGWLYANSLNGLYNFFKDVQLSRFAAIVGRGGQPLNPF